MNIEELKDYCKTSWLAFFFLPFELKSSLVNGYRHRSESESDKNNPAYAAWVADVCIKFDSSIKKMGFFRRWLLGDIITGFSASEEYKAYSSILQTKKSTSTSGLHISQHPSFSRLFQTNQDNRSAKDIAQLTMYNQHVAQKEKEIDAIKESASIEQKNNKLIMSSFFDQKISHTPTLSQQLLYAIDEKLEDVKAIMTQNSALITQNMLKEPLRRAALDGKLDIVQYFATLGDLKLNKRCISYASQGAIIGCQTKVLRYLLSLTGDYAPDYNLLKKDLRRRLLDVCENAPDEILSHPREHDVLFIISLEGELKSDAQLINNALKVAIATKGWDVVKILIEMDGDNKPNAESIAFAYSEAKRYDIELEDVAKQANRLQ